MYELLLVVVASAVGVGVGLASARPKARARPDLARAAKACALAAALFVASAAGAGPSPFARSSIVAAGWTAGACLFGALVAELGTFAAGPRDEHADARRAAARTILVQACVVLGLGIALLASCAVTGALRHPETLAAGAPRLVVGFAAGAALSDAAAAEVAIEAVLAMVPLAALFERNASILREGPVATSAIGLFALPLAVRALGFVGLGAAATALPKSARDRTGRGAWVFVTLAALATFGASFALAGLYWPAALFCGVAGVGAALVAWRAAERGSTAWLPLAAVGAAVIASVTIAARTGLGHGIGLALPLVVVGARLLVFSLETLLPAPRAALRVFGSTLLAPLGLLATADAATSSSCARWATLEMLPNADPAAILARCESARLAVDRVDLLSPAALAGAAVGAVLVFDTPEHESPITRGARGVVAVAVCVAMRLAFDSGGAAAAALVGAALLTAALAQKAAKTRVAVAVSAALVALTPLFA